MSQLNDCPTGSTACPRGFNDLPLELHEMILSHLLVPALPLVDPPTPFNLSEVYIRTSTHSTTMQLLPPSSFAVAGQDRSRSAVLLRASAVATICALHGLKQIDDHPKVWPTVLRVNRSLNQIGTRILYKHNRFLFTHPAALLDFVTRYPRAASLVERLIWVMRVQQATPSTQLLGAPISRTHDDTWKCNMFQSPDFVHHIAFTEAGLPVKFAKLKELTLHMEDWEQNEGAPRLVMRRHGGYSVFTTEYSGLTVPARLAMGGNIACWMETLARNGWKVQSPRITGMDALPSKIFVEMLEGVLTRNAKYGD